MGKLSSSFVSDSPPRSAPSRTSSPRALPRRASRRSPHGSHDAPPPAVRETFPLTELAGFIEDWSADAEARQLSPRTIEAHRDIFQKFGYYCDAHDHPTVNPAAVRGFLAHLRTGHLEPGGRWGNNEKYPHLAHARRPVSARTAETYYSKLQTLFNYLMKMELLDRSPSRLIDKPIARRDAVQPFTPEQIQALMDGVRQSRHSQRDLALLYTLFDTGARVSEVCGLRVGDVVLERGSGYLRVRGKGNKERTLPFGRQCHAVLYEYLRKAERNPRNPQRPLREEDEPLFPGERDDSQPLNRSGVSQILRRLQKRIGLSGVRVSPHTLRHTFAVTFLRDGGDSFTLQQLLGHTHPAMTAKYVNFARADIHESHRRHSPADSLKRPR